MPPTPAAENPEIARIQRLYEAQLAAKDELIAELRRQQPSGGAVPAPHAAAEDPGLARITAFSDGVFSIAITLLVLDIRLPDGLQGRSLPDALGGLWTNYLSFLISFIIVGLIWANHRTMFSYITRANHALVVANILLLLNIAFLPFPAAQLARFLDQPREQQVAVLLYSGTLAVGGVFYNWVWRVAVRGGLLDPAASPSVLRTLGRRYTLGPLLYSLAFALTFLNSWLGLGLCTALLVLYLVPGFTHELH